jgi:predicted nucleic acid-binding protein
VLVETIALLGRRVGLNAVGAFRERLQPLLDVVWVDDDLHDMGMESMLERGDRSLSLVDTISFLVMQRDGAHEAFAFDSHFEDEGFSLVE